MLCHNLLQNISPFPAFMHGLVQYMELLLVGWVASVTNPDYMIQKGVQTSMGCLCSLFNIERVLIDSQCPTNANELCK